MVVSIVLPYYNPPVNWSSNIVEQLGILKQGITEKVQLILVNDGSTDNIVDAETSLLKSNIPDVLFVVYSENKGKGHATRQGVEQATGDIIIYTDIDFPYTNESILKIYHILKNNEAEVAIGVKDAVYYDAVPRARKFISKILRLMIRTFFTIPFTDTQCGLKGFRKELRPVFLSTTINRYLFDLEFIRNSYKKGYNIKAVPVVLKEGVQFRKINYRILLPEIFNLVKLIFR